jgi:hypothetical protein
MCYPPSVDSSENANEIRRRANALVRSGEIYFARAEQLNDPFEASPHFYSPRTRDGLPDYESLAATLRRVYAPRWQWSEDRVKAAEADLKSKIERGTFDADMAFVAAKWGALFRKDYPMCCFAKHGDSIPMWSYYASGHAGVCVHFDATRAPIANSMRVSYGDNYPALAMPMGEIRPGEVIKHSLLTKSSAWSHEKEYRLINMPTYADSTGDTIVGRILDDLFHWPEGPQLAVVPARFIVGVTLGAQMESAHVEHFARICRDRRPPLPVFHARTHNSRYALQIEPARG